MYPMRHTLLALAVLAAPLVPTVALAQTADSTTASVMTTPMQVVEVPVPAEAPAPTQSLAEIVTTDTTFSILATALRQTNLLASLESGEFTLLAPTNAAFRALPNYPAILEPASARALYTVLMAHVVPGTYLGVHLPQMTALRTWAGTDLPVVTMPVLDTGAAMAMETATDSTTTAAVVAAEPKTVSTVGGADIVRGDVMATNGVLHALGRVVTVPEAQ